MQIKKFGPRSTSFILQHDLVQDDIVVITLKTKIDLLLLS